MVCVVCSSSIGADLDKSSKRVNMGQNSVKVQGSVSPGYESVKELFESNFKRGAEESAQLCVYVGEEKVVDLWCSMSDPGYTGDTLTNVFSSTKSLTAIAMASLVDKVQCLRCDADEK